MAQQAERLVGRADELGRIDQALTELDEGRPALIELIGEPGIGKTRLLAELARRADERGYTVLSGAASELERDLPFWVFVDALDEYLRGLEPHRLESLGEDVRGELAGVLPSLATSARPSRARGAPRALPQLSRRARAPGAARADAAARARARRPALGRPRLGRAARRRSCNGRRPLACSWPSPHGRGRCRSVSSRRSSAPIARRPSSAASSARSRATRPGSSSAQPYRRPRRRISTTTAAATRSTSSSSRACIDHAGPAPATAAEPSLGRRAGAAERGSGPGRGARDAVARGAPRARGRLGRRRPVRSRARGGGRRHDGRGRARCARRVAALRPRARDRRAAALPLPAPARAPLRLRDRRRAAGGSGRTSAARMRCTSAAPPRPHAPITSSAPLATATSRRSRRCARRATPPLSERPRALRAGTRPRCGCSRRRHRPRSGSRCCWRTRKRSPPAAASTRAAWR